MIDSLERSLAELRAELSPSSADKARLRASIVGPALAGGAHALPAPRLSRWGALRAAGSVGLATGALLLGAGVGVGFWLGREASPPSASLPETIAPAPALPPPAQPLVPAPTGDQAAPTAPGPPQVAANNPAPSEPRRSPARARPTHKAVAPNPLNDELALLRRVERALRNADPELALAVLGELDERFPDTRLVEERLAARLMAGCRLNDAAAIARAHAFLHDNPASVYRQRVQLACEGGVAPKQAADALMKDAVGPGH